MLAKPIVITCLLVPGLCGGPDAPGETRGAPPLRLTFRTARQPWDAVLRGRTLYVALPPHVLPDGSREAFVSLLEAAEEKLNCQHVVVVRNLHENFARNSFYCIILFVGVHQRPSRSGRIDTDIHVSRFCGSFANVTLGAAIPSQWECVYVVQHRVIDPQPSLGPFIFIL